MSFLTVVSIVGAVLGTIAGAALMVWGFIHMGVWWPLGIVAIYAFLKLCLYSGRKASTTSVVSETTPVLTHPPRNHWKEYGPTSLD